MRRVHWVHWVSRVQQVGLKIRFMFDGKGLEMDSIDQMFDAIIRDVYAQPFEPLAPPRWRRAAGLIGGTLLGLLSLAAFGGVLFLLAGCARIGWEFAGGVGW